MLVYAPQEVTTQQGNVTLANGYIKIIHLSLAQLYQRYQYNSIQIYCFRSWHSRHRSGPNYDEKQEDSTDDTADDTTDDTTDD